MAKVRNKLVATAFGHWIQARLAAKGRPGDYEWLATEAEKGGFKLSAGTARAIARRPSVNPRAGTMKAIESVLGHYDGHGEVRSDTIATEEITIGVANRYRELWREALAKLNQTEKEKVKVSFTIGD